jgi:hypothetical protein
MQIVWPKVLPVLVSIGIIIAVALLREVSKTFAVIAATMPINIPLSMWIISANSEDPKALENLLSLVAVNIIPTVIFVWVAWQATRMGATLWGSIGIGYVVWGLAQLGIMLARQALGA